MMKLLLVAIFLVPAASRAENVVMAFGEKIPPFCFPETDSGIEVEVIREALAFKKHKMRSVFLPFARVPIEFKEKLVDAAMTDLGEDMTPHGGFYGDSAVSYNNVFITLKQRNLKIKKPEDLQKLTIIGFQGAANRYPEWLKSNQSASQYSEINDQRAQVKLLLTGRIDVVLMDRNIFKYYANDINHNEQLKLPEISEHIFFKVNPKDYRPVFRNQKIRDDFNLGLREIKKSGRYEAIFDKYLSTK